MPAPCSTIRSTSAMRPTPPTCSSGSRTTRRATASSPPKGPVVLFDYFSCEHLSDHSGVVDEVRPAVSWIYLYGGELSRQARRALGSRHRRSGARAWRRQQPHRRRPPRPRRRRRTRPARRLRRQWRGGHGERAADQIARRDSLHAPLHRRLRGGDGRDGGGAEARHFRERAVGRTAPRQHRARRRMDRDAAAVLGPAHQSVVPGMLVAHHRGRRSRRLRHRPHRPLRLLRRPVAHLALRRRQTDRTSSATCSASPPTRSPTTPN